MTELERLQRAADRVKELAAAAQLTVHVEVIAAESGYFDGEVRVDFRWSIGWDVTWPVAEEGWSSYRVVHYPGTRQQPAEEDFEPFEEAYRLDQIAANVLAEVVKDRICDFREREQEDALLAEEEESAP